MLHFWFTLQDGEIFGSVSYENPAVFRLFELKNSEAWVVLLQFAHDSQLCIVFWVNAFNYKWSPVFVAGGRHVLAGGREGDSERSLSLFASWSLKATLSVHACHY